MRCPLAALEHVLGQVDFGTGAYDVSSAGWWALAGALAVAVPLVRASMGLL